MQATDKRTTDKPTQPRRAVASSETAREINRDILLHAIHLHQPVSRADLARLTGLQPSTVSVITGQLIDEGWVLPGALGRLPRGRRPTYMSLNDRHVALAIDLRPGRAGLLSHARHRKYGDDVRIFAHYRRASHLSELRGVFCLIDDDCTGYFAKHL